jgi:hypothetical protein
MPEMASWISVCEVMPRKTVPTRPPQANQKSKSLEKLLKILERGYIRVLKSSSFVKSLQQHKDGIQWDQLWAQCRTVGSKLLATNSIVGSQSLELWILYGGYGFGGDVP